MTHSIDFFETQFRRQATDGEYALNPFERAVLPFLRGEVLDLGCGLGNLALAAARTGCTVHALDASPSAIEDLARRAKAEGARLEARLEDLRAWRAARAYDCVVSVGLLMFFSRKEAEALLREIPLAVRPGGIAALNVLVEGTTYLDMFDPDAHCLFARQELIRALPGWSELYCAYEDFPAPRGTVKRFHTYVARRP